MTSAITRLSDGAVAEDMPALRQRRERRLLAGQLRDGALEQAAAAADGAAVGAALRGCLLV